MRWRNARRSENVKDRRHVRAGPGLALGGAGTVVVVVLFLVFGGDPRALFDMLGVGGERAPQRASSQEEEELVEFVEVVLGETETVWAELFGDAGRSYREPELILFRDGVRSGCGFAGSAVGPFYCPPDEKVYIDLGFFELLHRRFDAPGDFAQAYVIAHEVGHHVQNLLGASDRVHAARERLSEAEYNRLSVRLELQADYYAGVWAKLAAEGGRVVLDPGDLREALRAARAIGDDTLQKESQGRVVPDSFTHGTSEQRERWLLLGWERATIEGGDTFALADGEL